MEMRSRGKSLLDSPAAAIALFTGLCLLAFWLSAFIVRPDGSFLGSDGTQYYAYLPSILLDGDLDFSDDFTRLMAGEPEKLAYFLENRTPRGLVFNTWSIGPAILWTPIFLLIHGFLHMVRLLGVPVAVDGYGHAYQFGVLTGSIIYAGTGLWLMYLGLRRIFDDVRSLVAATLLVAAAGNVVYYMTVAPHMSHAPGLLATGLFFYIWLTTRGRESWRTAMALGASAGLMALIRPQDGLFLLLPFVDRLLAIASERDSRGVVLARLVRDGLIAAAVALVVFSPQLVVWELLWGTFLRSPYAIRGEHFDWAHPHGLSVLFSFHRGLFVWHPIYLLGLLGLGWIFRRDRRTAVVFLLGFAIQWYLIASWWAWDQGKSFGGRMFIVCTPMIVLGLAAALQKARERGWFSAALTGGAALVAANAMFIVLYYLSW